MTADNNRSAQKILDTLNALADIYGEEVSAELQIVCFDLMGKLEDMGFTVDQDGDGRFTICR